MLSILTGSVLWHANAFFNYIASDYRTFFINLLYVICLITLGGATFRNEKNVTQGMIGALLMISVVGNVNVLSEMLPIDIPSRKLWQLIFGFTIMLGIFVNHFLISHFKYQNDKRIKTNQILVIVLLIFRIYQITINLINGGFTPIMIEVTIGMLAIIPTLNVIVCIECRSDAYKIQ